MKIRALLAALLLTPLFIARARADEDGDDEAAAIVHRYGLENVEKLAALKFTFNVREGTATATRAWTWEIPSGKISLSTREAGKPVTLSFNLNAPGAGNARQNRRANAWFENDREWLLLPLQIANDRNVDITLDEDEPLPVPPGTADCLVVDPVEMPNVPPADAHEIYFDSDRIIQQTVLRKNGSPTPTLVLQWSELAHAGPILVSLRRKTADARTEIWFTDVQVQLRDASDWVRARPGR